MHSSCLDHAVVWHDASPLHAVSNSPYYAVLQYTLLLHVLITFLGHCLVYTM